MDHALVPSYPKSQDSDCAVASLAPASWPWNAPCVWIVQVAAVLAVIVIVLASLLCVIGTSKCVRARSGRRDESHRLGDGTLYEGFALSR